MIGSAITGTLRRTPEAGPAPAPVLPDQGRDAFPGCGPSVGHGRLVGVLRTGILVVT